MADFLILCKSYHRDVLRARRFAESVLRHNREGIPLVLCVPQADAALFRRTLPGTLELVHDEDVVGAHPQAGERALAERYRRTPGSHTQQVVKADAWRLLGCKSYLCADSDTVFLRDFSHSDFLAPAGHPYTLLHQSRDLMQLALDRGQPRVFEHFIAESARLREMFGRNGPHYDFGPQPLLWSARVWDDLHERWLAPRGWTLWDAIDAMPSEIRWYGEALLALRSIPLDPVEPLFRVYHHDWQFDLLRRLGETPERVARQHLGAVYQSNWEIALDPPGTRSLASRCVRRLKRALRR